MDSTTLKIYQKIKDGKHHEAVFLAEKEYQSNKESQEALVNYVLVLLQLGNLDKAESVLISDSRKPTASLSVYLLYQDLYFKKGDFHSLEKLKKINPSFTIPENIEILPSDKSNASVRPDKDYFKSQLLDLLKLLSIKYPDGSNNFKRAYNLINHNALQEGKQFLHIFAHSIEDKALGRFIFAELELFEGRFRAAKKRYIKILDDFKEKWLIYDRLGDICLITGDDDEAEKNYLKSSELNPGDINIHLDLIKTYVLKKDFKSAKKAFNKASSRFGKGKLEPLRQIIENKRESSENSYVKGLCWYEGGGDVFGIEMETQPGSGKVKPMGNLGFQMLDSIHVAYAVATKIVSQKKTFKMDKDILINISNGIVYKDGPSAGLAFTVGIVGKLLNKPILGNIAFTGEVSLSGDIIPIGGLEGKLTAAYLNNIQTVYMPRGNFYTLQGMSDTVKSKLRLRLVDRVKKLVESLWDI